MTSGPTLSGASSYSSASGPAREGNGTWELPFGPNHLLLNNAPNFIQRLVERWQLGGILTRMSGTPLNITSLIATMTQGASVSTPNIVGDFPKRRLNF